MVFSSLLFIFAFLFPTLLIYTLVPKHLKNTVLLVSSLIFYAWGGVQYVFLLVGETLISWFCALAIQNQKKHSVKRAMMIVECVSLLGLLGVFKYLGFFSSNLQALTGWPQNIPQIVLPIGISFYTFQLLSYVIDVYKGEVSAQPVFWKLLLYSSLFHQCIAGPIVRYSTVADEIDNRKVSSSDIYTGIRRFSIGLAKKSILANGCAALADGLIANGTAGLSFGAYWLTMIAFTLEIYLDFSAYSDMAIGMGRMVGFHYLENFNYPYQAKSIQEFWRKWHISLSTFFRDYIYIPLGGSRGGVWVYVRNMIVVWFLTGMWHGASWNYILWGLYYLVFLLLERFWIKERIPNGWNTVYTLSVILVGWTLFRFENNADMINVLLGLIGIHAGGIIDGPTVTVFLSNMFLLAAAVIGCTNLSVLFNNFLAETARKNQVVFKAYEVLEAALPVTLLALSTLALVGNAYNPFLYFQF